MAALLLAASCSQDEFSDKQDTLLPEGVYPLEISSVTLDVEGSEQPWNAPQTRVSENEKGNGSVWNKGDKIKVQIDKGTSGTYTYQDDGNLTVVEGDVPAYWKSSDADQTITAWYPEEESIDLANQSNGLVYVLRATTQANFNTEVSLPFEHSLSKIRVKLTGEKEEDVTSVQVKSHTQCTNANGEVTAFSSENWIEMKNCTYNGEKCWEANVVPDYEIEEIQLNGKTPCTFTSFKSKAGNCHEITINVKSKYISIGGDDDYTVEENKPVIINGSGTVTFENYNIDNYEGDAIKIESGTPILKFKGTNNNIKCSGTPILLGEGASVTISGGGTDKSQLKVIAGGNSAGIGSGSGDNADNIPTACGNITIENITLHANGGTNTNSSGAAIGTSAWYAGSCGNITITNSIVHAKGGKGAAAIGTGYSIYRGATCGKITINQSKIYATVEYFNPFGVEMYAGYGACIGHGASLCNVEYTASVGEIIITTNEGETEDTFFSDFKGINEDKDTVTSGFYKVGKGSAPQPGNQVWIGVKFNDNTLATGNNNGYPIQ